MYRPALFYHNILGEHMTEHKCLYTDINVLSIKHTQTGTYLHADLVEHQASCVVKETVSFPTELHSVLLHLMQHWDKDRHKEEKEWRGVRVSRKPVWWRSLFSSAFLFLTRLPHFLSLISFPLFSSSLISPSFHHLSPLVYLIKFPDHSLCEDYTPTDSAVTMVNLSFWTS